MILAQSRALKSTADARVVLAGLHQGDAAAFAQALESGCVLPDASHNQQAHSPCVIVEQYGPHCTEDGLRCLLSIPDLVLGPDCLAYQGTEVTLWELHFQEGEAGLRYEATVAITRQGVEREHRFTGGFSLFPSGEDAGRLHSLTPDDQTTWQYYGQK